MCKIVAFTNTAKIKTKKASESIGNILLGEEKDGYGYAVQGQGGVYGEKTVKPRFKSRLDATNVVTLPIVKNLQSKFGNASTNAGPGIFHGRTSTNIKGLKNCHPMQRDGWHLIHNGVVDDEGEKYQKKTDNDSEDVLYRLIQGIDQVEQKLTGYYAFAAIDPNGLLHVCRDSLATLYIAKSPNLDTYIIATTEKVLRAVAKSLKAEIGPVDEIKNNVYMVFKGNEIIHHQRITSRGYTNRQASYANLSLGRSITSANGWSAFGHHRPGPTVIDVSSRANEGWPDNETGGLPESFFQRTENEDAYYQWRHEIDGMDASYQIINGDGNQITILEFRKLDHIAQEQCIVTRGDGTVVEPPISTSKAV